MRCSSVCLFVLLGAAGAAFGLDLMTYRQSCSRASRGTWAVDVDLGSVDEFGRRAQQSGGLYATADWRAAILSEDLDFDAEVSAVTQAAAHNSDAPDTLPEPRHGLSAGLLLNPTATCHYYPFKNDAFVRGALYARGDIAMHDEREGTEWRKFREIGLDLGNAEIGLGYGRTRDAWPLYRAARLTRILKEEGVLVRELSDDDLRDLGGFVSRAWKLFYAHERAAKFYYDSLEQWLMHAGAITEPLPAYALFRLDETPFIGSDERRFGMRGFFTANVEARRLSVSHERTDSAWTELDTLFRPSCQVGWEFSGLSGLRWSYGASAAYILPWPVLPDSGMRQQLVLAGSASYDITDRLVTSYRLDLQPFHQSPVSPNGTSHLSLPAVQAIVFSYYLSERFAVRVGGRYGTEFDHYYNSHYHRTEFRHRWSAALTMTFGRIPAGWGVHYYL